MRKSFGAKPFLYPQPVLMIASYDADGMPDRCGYVSTTLRRDHDDFDIDCHGGLTFGGALPEAHAPKEVFYIGFDCGHVCDGIDAELAYKYGLVDETEREYFKESFSYLSDYPVRDVDYVEKQCKKIADQLEELEK